ncbi:Retrovirus-related Pol polyprotein from transposon TNT 1-94 [Cinnamomum micranthum f. kanehirae]|uniref:Retrovirus-related Pol polyprotein from transposon TNT 1-94 n=1 Tax=Cinnamomum micranthum f. kanehirae TaxID=337451 RepID=A0A3S3MQH6_9MAGN|nr:Retrovirus-related Pol polyprotein from transposon TNT 1-94 [Cinnamomum micranthum f. kanehirae]
MKSIKIGISIRLSLYYDFFALHLHPLHHGLASSASSPSSTTVVSSSSSSSTVIPNLVISNIANLIPIKLDSTNFLLWKSLFCPILRSHQLEHFIDGSQPIPSREIISADGKTTPNHAFFVWFERDQTLLSWINATLSASALPYIVGKETAKDAWESLEHRYGSLSRSHVIELKKRLQHVKKGSSTMQEYLHQIKVISDQLATCGAPVSEDDLILYFLSGLPSVYRPFQTTIRTRSRHDPVSLEELHTLLVCEELSLADDLTIEASTAFTARKSTPIPQGQSPASSSSYQHRSPNSASRSYRPSSNRQSGSSDTSGQRKPLQHTGSSTSQPHPTCQICGKVGHLAIDCYHRMDFAFQGRHPPQRLAAMVASHQPTLSQSWYSDTGATHHVTSDLDNLSIHSPYHGSDSIQVGNGAALSISNTGQSFGEDALPRPI